MSSFKKHLKANNKYMTDYNQDVISNYIMYLDANNLYACGMIAKLPCSDFKWSEDIKNAEDVLNYDNGDDGYILEVDLEYPIELHDAHSDYPLAPENKTISADMISEFSKQIYSEYHYGKQCNGDKVKKLILGVNDKNMLFMLEI